MLRFATQTTIDHECLIAAATQPASGLPVPSLLELAELAAVKEEPAIRVTKVHDGERLVGLAICYVEKGVVHGIPVTAYRSFGDKLHDYTRLYAASDESMTALLGAIRKDARRYGADVINLSNQLVPQWLEQIPAACRTASETSLFDAAKDTAGWEAILSRKSVQRDWKKVAKQPGYKAETLQGTLTRDDIQALAAMHRERWGFADVRSPFENARRVEEYLCYPTNKVLTKIMLGNEMLCCHYGMRYGNLLLFHTPIINIKYLDLSPLKTLIMETAKFCQAENMQILDLGLGDESYKEYSANRTRTVHEIVIPISLRGKLVQCLHSHGRAARIKECVGKLSELRKRFFSPRHAATEVQWYERKAHATHMPEGIAILEKYVDFVDFCRQNKVSVKKTHYRRFREKNFFIAVMGNDGSHIQASAWGCRISATTPVEQGMTASSANCMALTDIMSPPESLEKLLQAAAALFPAQRQLVAAPTADMALTAAIRHAGFHACAMPPNPPSADAGG